MTTGELALNVKDFGLMCLDAEQIKRIDKALTEIGDFGEVRLIKARGKIRFIQKVSSEEIGGGMASRDAG
jgi:hypothetical protein